ncbi:MAG: cytochrome c [Alphaproteobacteria bacterium]|nr:MAG: cytochrome c [Alphaproteobacteria bacterium]
MVGRGSLALVLATAIAAPVWAGEGDASRGEAYARAMCASCHAVTAGMEASPNPAAPPLRDAKAESGKALATFFNTVHPNTSRLLKDEQAGDIFTYIESLRAPAPG